MVSSLVFAPRITSTSFMRTAGLKKCIPTTCPGLVVAPAISVMLILEVFEASTACLGASLSSSRNIPFLVSITSGTASMIKSASLTASSSPTTISILPSMSLWLSSEILPFPASFARLSLIRLRPLSTNSCLISFRVTLYPPSRATSAMPCPISPAPTTAIFFMSFTFILGAPSLYLFTPL